MSADSSGDLQSNMTLELGNTLKGMKQLADALDNLRKKTQQLNQQNEDLQKKSTKGFKDIGALAAKIPGGGIFRDVFDSAADSSATFGRVAAGIGIAIFAWEAYKKVVDANIARAHAFNDAQKKQIDLLKASREAQDAEADKGRAQDTESYRAMIAAGGPNAQYAARRMQATGAISPEQSVESAAKIFGKFGNDLKRTTNVVDAIIMAAKVGLNTSEITDKLTKDYGIAGSPAALKNVVAMSLQQKTGQFGDPRKQLEYALLQQSVDPYQTAVASQAATTQNVEANQRQATIAYGARGAGAAASAARDPTLALLINANTDAEAQIRELRNLAKSQGALISTLADVFTPGGSFETQMQRAQNARWNANP